MIIIELLIEILVEVISIDFIGGLFSRVNNSVLKLRGIENQSPEAIKFDKLKKRYEYKTIKLKKEVDKFEKGTKGIVLELIDSKYAYVEISDVQRVVVVVKIDLKSILVTRSNT